MKAYVQKGNNELVRRCWSHSIACAVISETLAATIRVSKEHAYTAGLLHEMGRLGLLITYPKEYGLLASQPISDMQSSLEAERQLLGLDHCQAGLWLTRTWNLPEEFRDANARHHEPPQGPRDLLFAVRAGCLLAETLGFPEAMPPTEMPTLDELESVLPRGSSQDLPGWFADMRERIVESIDMLRN
jgi:HD-like signal output (HDOD) protein